MVEYVEYKDSSYDWLGKIPTHWDEKFLEQTASEKCIKNVGNNVQQVLSLSYGEIIKKNNLNKGLIAQDLSTYQFVCPGDIIMRLTDLQNDHKSLRTGLVRNEGIITAAYLCLVPRISPEYLHYLLHAYDVKKVFYGMGGGVRQSIGFKDIRHMVVPVPPRDEQDQIVRFLDWKVSEINKLIGIRRKEIQELEELRKKLVRTVITGKSMQCEMKDTSINWIGSIPIDWNIRYVKNVATITNGSDPKTSGDIPVYGSGEGAFKTCGEYKEGPAVLIGRKGATLHIPHYIEGRYWNVDTAFDVHMKENNDLKWFYYLAQCFDYQFYISKTTLPSMTQTDYNNMPIPVPLASTQHEIAVYLDQECWNINRAITLARKKVDALQELKSTIISDTVTGKIDVRNISVPEYEHVDDIADNETENEEEPEATEFDGEEA